MACNLGMLMVELFVRFFERLFMIAYRCIFLGVNKSHFKKEAPEIIHVHIGAYSGVPIVLLVEHI